MARVKARGRPLEGAREAMVSVSVETRDRLKRIATARGVTIRALVLGWCDREEEALAPQLRALARLQAKAGATSDV